MVDQGLYSLGNFLLTILVARSVGPAAFGAYSIVAVTYLLAIAVTRGLTSETFVVSHSTRAETPEGRAAWRAAAAGAGGTALLSGLVAGLVMLGIGLIAGPGDADTLGSTALVFALFLPALAVQDFWRFAALALGRPVLALVNDLVVVVLQVGGAVTVIALGDASVAAFVAVWGGGAVVGAALGARQLKVLPRPARAREWWRAHRDLAGRYAIDDAANQGAQQASNYVVALVGGLSQTGALRAGVTVFAPPSILNLGVQTAVTPELVRLLRRDPARMRRAATMLGGGLALVGLVWGGIALALPDSAGRALFGQTWPHARALVGFLAIGQVFNGIRVAPQASLRALADARRTLQARWVGIGLGLPLTVGAAFTGEARNVAIGIAVIAPIQALTWSVFARRAYTAHVAARATITAGR